MDKRRNNGGHSTKGKAGRKSKVHELKVIETLDADIDPADAVKKLKELINDGNIQAIKMYFEYRFGKTKEMQSDDNMKENMIFKPIDLDVVDDELNTKQDFSFNKIVKHLTAPKSENESKN